MKSLPNWKTHKDCLKCGNKMYGQFDKYCSRCGAELTGHDEWLADISDYAASLLIEFLEDTREIALKTDFHEIPAIACEGINANATVECNSWATRHILAENWNQVEIALDDWHENSGSQYRWEGIERLHVFCVTQHAEMIWREIENESDYMSDDEIDDAIRQIKNR
jgi:hypothetical protein